MKKDRTEEMNEIMMAAYGSDYNYTLAHKTTFLQRLGRFRPDTVFDLMIRVPFFEIRTSTMCYVYERLEWVYFLLHVKIWRWSFSIRLGRKER